LIGTISGHVYVWNLKNKNGPQHLVHLFKSVTSIRTSHGS
jgi:hypothetical protein